jgi:hypothetical protein
MLKAMEFEFKRIVVKGVKMVQYLGQKNVLLYEDLPLEYVQGGTYVRLNAAGRGVVYAEGQGPTRYLYSGDLMNIEELQKFNDLMIDAGTRLGKIRKEGNAKLEEAWHGEFVVEV